MRMIVIGHPWSLAFEYSRWQAKWNTKVARLDKIPCLKRNFGASQPPMTPMSLCLDSLDEHPKILWRPRLAVGSSEKKLKFKRRNGSRHSLFHVLLIFVYFFLHFFLWSSSGAFHLCFFCFCGPPPGVFRTSLCGVKLFLFFLYWETTLAELQIPQYNELMTHHTTFPLRKENSTTENSHKTAPVPSKWSQPGQAKKKHSNTRNQ